ncbi:CsbD family protein [Rhodovastum atsumiense]|uniref:CsbD family protein n=1 Tax=Rhodovastum atsumiense TaxID=504468 RepID=A0A5M6ISB4_9PROT|nr:CsbD family protein [Rhodovastum atsumiense]KAA5610458.1 CsbD family protein [Rhodovastum atsumiense]CAH2600442.1 CsbD family protein [Rhodovastum atsumiense]
MVDTNTISGTARDMAGRVQDTVGNAVGDTRTRAQGVANQAYGQAERYTGQASDLIRDQPLTSALVALGIGFIIGRLSS